MLHTKLGNSAFGGKASGPLDPKCLVLALTFISNIFKFKIGGNQSKKRRKKFHDDRMI